MRPDIDHFVVTFARRDDALAILLLDFVNLLLRRLDLLALLLRNDHVIDSDRDTGPRRFAEAQLFEPVERRDSFFVATDFVTAPDQIAQGRFADDFVRETKFFGPDFAEDDAPNGGLNDLLVGITILTLAAIIRIGQLDTLVRRDRTVGISEDDFALGAEQFEARCVLYNVGPRLGRQIITAQGNVLGRRHNRLAAGRAEDVVRGHHQEPRFHLRLD